MPSQVMCQTRPDSTEAVHFVAGQFAGWRRGMSHPTVSWHQKVPGGAFTANPAVPTGAAPLIRDAPPD